MPDGVDPCSFISTAPSDAWALLPPDSTNEPEWVSTLVIERMRAHLSMCCDRRGSSSLMRTPRTLVGMVPYGPRTWIGALGFGSNVSRWLGPPLRKMKMHAGSRLREPVLA